MGHGGGAGLSQLADVPFRALLGEGGCLTCRPTFIKQDGRRGCPPSCTHATARRRPVAVLLHIGTLKAISKNPASAPLPNPPPSAPLPPCLCRTAGDQVDYIAPLKQAARCDSSCDGGTDRSFGADPSACEQEDSQRMLRESQTLRVDHAVFTNFFFASRDKAFDLMMAQWCNCRCAGV